MMKITRSILLGFSLVAAFNLISGTASAMNIFKNDFEKRWSELSQDVKKLNEYTKIHLVELRDVKAEGLKLEGVVFTDSTFSGVEWENVNASKAVLTKVIFRKCKFIGGKWKDGILTDVIFEDCEFYDTSLSGCTVANIQFKNCKINHTGIGYLKGGKVEFEGCNWDMGAGGDSSCEFVFKNCTLSGISFSMMKNNVPILFEDTLLDEIDFYGSHFSTVTLRRVRQGEEPVRFNSSIVDTFTFDNVDMTRGVSLAFVKANLVRITGGRFGAAFEGSMIAKVLAQGAFLANIDFSEATMPHVGIGNCELYDLAIWDAIIEEFSIMASTINIIDATEFKGEIVLWDNVTLDGKIDLTNAQVKDFRPTRLKRGPKLNLITTGSNMRF
jgi:uncharacterized protein YjbI with pentapeptide repeats